MAWQLYLDDERFPPDGEWIICRSVDKAITLCEVMGCPNFVSFDHDLGENSKTGKDFANWLVERDMDKHRTFIPMSFDYHVHSQNPIGTDNIKFFLAQYLTERFGGND